MVPHTYIYSCDCYSTATASWSCSDGTTTTGFCAISGRSYIVATSYLEPIPELNLDPKPKKKPSPAPPYQSRMVKAAEHRVRHEARWLKFAGLPMYAQTRRRALEQKVGG